MLGQHGFLSNVFDIFRDCQMSVDVVATSEVSISLTLDKTQRAKGDPDRLVRMLGEFSDVKIKDDRAIISLIANVDRSSEVKITTPCSSLNAHTLSKVMAMVFAVLQREGIRVEMLSQGASKVNISLVVHLDHAQRAVKALHACFFEQSA
jgi:aspartate kinase